MKLKSNSSQKLKTSVFSLSGHIKSLLDKNLKPIFKIVEVCPLINFEDREAYHISLYNFCELTNSDERGQGNKNRKRELIQNGNYRNKKVYQYDLNGEFI